MPLTWRKGMEDRLSNLEESNGSDNDKRIKTLENKVKALEKELKELKKDKE